MVQCILGHVDAISHDFVDSNRAISNLHGKWFGFSHGLDPFETVVNDGSKEA
jgi:hypothetical protein